ncbi:MAG: DUF1835 domain-containing protein [Bacteroidetes bacterium]|nr:MAG: DUF1835 domain-containing protein [Bacteroidota bacterium]
MIHVVFNAADKHVLEQVIALDATLEGPVFQIMDDYAVGPLNKLDTPDGWQARRNWWQALLQITAEYPVQETMDMVQDKLTLHTLLKQLEEDANEVIWIWAAQNKHDVCGYYWSISQMAAASGRVFILYLNNLPFINEKGGIFYPTWLHQIQPKEFLKAKKLARPVTPSEFEIDGDEWARLCADNQMVRLLEGGKKIIGKPESFYDNALLSYLTGDFQKAHRIIQTFLAKERETTGDLFLLWRLKQLVAANALELRGDIEKSSKEFELRNPQLPMGKKKGGDVEKA